MPDSQFTLSQQLFDFFHKMSLILLICVSIRTSSQFSKETAYENIECNKGKGEKRSTPIFTMSDSIQCPFMLCLITFKISMIFKIIFKLEKLQYLPHY